MKTNKVLKIVGFSLLGVVLFGGAILGFVNPSLLKKIIDYVKELLNQPLPIIGITVGACLIFVWRLLVVAKYGKGKLAEYDKAVKQIENAHKDFMQKANNEIALLQKRNAELESKLSHACSLSTNKKIKDYGKELDYGKETINIETKEE